MDIHAFFSSEVKPTVGCTEPGAVAYAAAFARTHCTAAPTRMQLAVSIAIYKNGRSVGIPGTDGLRGLDMACALGGLMGDAQKGLMCLGGISPEGIQAAKEFLATGQLNTTIDHDKAGVWVCVTLETPAETVSCTISQRHDHVERVCVNGVEVFSQPTLAVTTQDWSTHFSVMNFADLWELAMGIDAETQQLMLAGATMNMGIVQGASSTQAGRGIGAAMEKQLANEPLPNKVKRISGCASDLRMSGMDVQVMSSAGSGNHGIVAVIPVSIVAEELGVSAQKHAQALALSHLVCGYIKSYTGRLTPTCGCAMAAGAGAAAGITYLYDGTVVQAEHAAITLVGTLLGMICDGAKESCGLKVSSAAGEAWNSSMLALENRGIQNTQGLISTDIQQLGKTLRELNTQVFAGADRVMVDLMTRQ